jgi:capsular exopolysaccharide synthesis family protein
MVFAVNAYSPDPVKAAAIANAVAEAYIEDQLDAKLEVTRRATEWLSVRSEELRARLEESEERVEMARRSSQLINETALQAENRQLKDLRQRASELERDLRTRDLQLEALRSLSRTGGTTLPDAVTVSPQLVQISRQLATATGEREAVLREQFTMQLERDIATAEAQRRLIEEQRALVESSTAEMESEISRKSAELIALRQLERESEANRAVYEFFLTRMNETSAQAGIQRPDARMLSHAVAPTAPTTPRVMRAYAIAIFLAMILGSTVIVARDRMQTSFRSPREFEKAIGKRVLAMIPEAPTSGRRKLFDFMLANRGSNFAEAIRNLRTSILLSWIDQPKQVVMVTSSTPAEGKTTVSLSLAVDFARTGKKVLLVECDIRRRVFSQYMKTDEAKGVVAVLAGTATLEEALVHNAEGGVDVLPAERQNVQAVDLFTSQRFSHFIDEMRQRYDLIVLDTPPVLAVSDPRIIARNADAIIYAVRWGVTPAATVQDGAGQFAGDDMANIGFVMTRVNMKKVMQYSYGGRYSYQSYRAIDRYYTS